jgi:hypothetical protein
MLGTTDIRTSLITSASYQSTLAHNIDGEVMAVMRVRPPRWPKRLVRGLELRSKRPWFQRRRNGTAESSPERERWINGACIYCAVYIRNDEIVRAVMIMKSRRDVDMNSER